MCIQRWLIQRTEVRRTNEWPSSSRTLDRGLKAGDWLNLLSAIKLQRCTPFLGAGASAEELPAGSQIAKRWADDFGYPLADSNDLIRVAQFVKLEERPEFLKDQVNERFKRMSPEFRDHATHNVPRELRTPASQAQCAKQSQYNHFLSMNRSFAAPVQPGELG